MRLRDGRRYRYKEEAPTNSRNSLPVPAPSPAGNDHKNKRKAIGSFPGQVENMVTSDTSNTVVEESLNKTVFRRTNEKLLTSTSASFKKDLPINLRERLLTSSPGAFANKNFHKRDEINVQFLTSTPAAATEEISRNGTEEKLLSTPKSQKENKSRSKNIKEVSESIFRRRPVASHTLHYMSTEEKGSKINPNRSFVIDRLGTESTTKIYSELKPRLSENDVIDFEVKPKLLDNDVIDFGSSGVFLSSENIKNTYLSEGISNFTQIKGSSENKFNVYEGEEIVSRQPNISTEFQTSASSVSSVETQLFHDMSLLETAKYFTSFFKSEEHKKNETSFYKLDGTFLSGSSFSDDEDHLDLYRATNHKKRSFFRQRRREWYLYQNSQSRFSFLRRIYVFYLRTLIKTAFKYLNKSTSLLVRSLTLLFGILIAKPMLIMKSAIYNIYCNARKKLKWGTGPSSSSSYSSMFDIQQMNRNVSHLFYSSWIEKGSPFGSCGGLCCAIFLLALFLPLLFVLTGMASEETQLVNFSNPEALNVSSAVSSVISKSGRNVLIWNIYKGSRDLINASPGLFYLRSEGDPHDLVRRKKYQVLASMGYHVIVPVRQLDDQDISVSWTWLKENKNKSSLYLWGDQVDASVLAKYAKSFCSQGIPLDGIIADAIVKNVSIQERNVEVWSCNCTNVMKANGHFHKYNNIHCPINVNVEEKSDKTGGDLYDQITSCIEGLHKDL